MASVVKGIATSSILNTYETERRSIAIFNTELSIQNFRAAMAVPAVLGLDPTTANSVHRIINEGVGSILPSGLQRVILDGIFTIVEYSVVSKLDVGIAEPLDAASAQQVRYLEGALIPDSNGGLGAPEGPTGRQRDYVPCVDPGARLPHMNVRILSDTSSEVTISTLGLVSGDKVEFLLIIAPTEPSYHLAHAAFKVAEEFKVSARVCVCVLWPAGSVRGVEARSKASLGVKPHTKDQETDGINLKLK
ncbi:hypothetical protein DVH24_033778 [Malus domestica]|uniref:FAD-binding domain-containing protein n=1 Tax=Malus domestica TaxID=3750 RepID=A0A498HND5_MALDO|nr:hypothetical protein DVH24_033778 [Malus domestica]